MALTEEEILEYKKQIDKAKTKIATFTGQYNAVLNQLKEASGCQTSKEAKLKLKQLEAKKLELDLKIEKACSDLEKQLSE